MCVIYAIAFLLGFLLFRFQAGATLQSLFEGNKCGGPAGTAARQQSRVLAPALWCSASPAYSPVYWLRLSGALQALVWLLSVMIRGRLTLMVGCRWNIAGQDIGFKNLPWFICRHVISVKANFVLSEFSELSIT